MASPFRTFVVVERPNFQVKVYRRSLTSSKWKITRKYSCAVGAIGYATPGGMWEIDWKVLDPDWTMPDSPWVPEEDRGKIIPAGDPGNPLKAAFISIAAGDGVGFHGTANIGSLGTRASHGCIRMSSNDVLNLYKVVAKATPVYIV